MYRVLNTQLLWLGESWDPVNGFYYPSWMAEVTSTPIDRPKFVRNQYVIEGLVAFLCCLSSSVRTYVHL